MGSGVFHGEGDSTAACRTRGAVYPATAEMKAEWQDGLLQVDTKRGRRAEMLETWELSPDGNRLTVRQSPPSGRKRHWSPRRSSIGQEVVTGSSVPAYCTIQSARAASSVCISSRPADMLSPLQSTQWLVLPSRWNVPPHLPPSAGFSGSL